MPLIRNALKPLAKIILIPVGLTTAADAAIRKKMFGLGRHPSNLASPLLDLRSRTTTLIISNEEMNYIMKIHKSLEESGLLIKCISKTIKNKAKEQKGEFLGMLLGTLDASLLGNLLTDKGTVRPGEGTIIAGQDF